MSFERMVVEHVDEKFAKKRERALENLAKRKDEIFEKFPPLSEIDMKLSLTAPSLAHAVAVGAPSSKIDEIRKRNTQLIKARSEILINNGYPADYLSIRHECQKCRDWGFIGNEMCDCYKSALAQERYEACIRENGLPEHDFSEFNLELYQKNAPFNDITEYEQMTQVLKKCRDFAANFKVQKKNLLLQGRSGVGKTFLSGCIAKEAIGNGIEVLYDTAHNIFSMLERDRFTKNEVENSKISRLYNCELLIIDDLGTEPITNFSVSALYNLLNIRLQKGKKMVISTNLDLPELEKSYSMRIMSRLLGEFTLLECCGEDLRLK